MLTQGYANRLLNNRPLKRYFDFKNEKLDATLIFKTNNANSCLLAWLHRMVTTNDIPPLMTLSITKVYSYKIMTGKK